MRSFRDHDSPSSPKESLRTVRPLSSLSKKVIGHVPSSDRQSRQEQPLFVEDSRGDRQNLSYGSLDRHAVPRYYTAGYGALLGAAPNYRITSQSETRREVDNLAFDTSRKSRRESLLASVFEADTASVLKPLDTDQERDLRKDFLRFDTVPARKRRRQSSHSDGSGCAEEASEMSISDHDTNTEERPEDPFETFKNDPVHQRQLQLSKLTMQHPNNAQGWLKLVDHQRHVFNEPNGDSSPRRLAELRVSIYEQGLSSVQDPDGRHSLIIGMMQEGRRIWDGDKQARKWQSILDKDPSFDLWVLFLNFQQSNPVRSSFEECLQTYKLCFEKMRTTLSDRKRDLALAYLLLRVTLFLWQSGFTEWAIGIWQANLEYNFFRPPHLTSEQLGLSFENFWASEVARIGEKGAKGWASGNSSEPEASSDGIRPNVEKLDFVAWANTEMRLEQTSALPARALDDVNENDPYRNLLHSDISEFLCSATSEQGVMLIRDAFLIFVGLPGLDCNRESHVWSSDPFVHQSLSSGATRSTSRDLLNMFSRQCISVAFDQLLTTSVGQESLLSGTGRLVDSYPSFARQAVHQLADAALIKETDESMLIYDVALESVYDFKSARRRAESFLRVKSDSLRLYNAYAILEAQSGDAEAADRVWSTALSMCRSTGKDVKRSAFLLWRDWACNFMLKKRFSKARALLSKIADSEIDLREFESDAGTVSVSSQLRVEHYVNATLNAVHANGEFQYFPVLVDILAIYKYLNHELQLETALDIYQVWLKRLTVTDTDEATATEVVHENRALLIHAHCTKFGLPFRPKELRRILAESATVFPKNSYLAAQYYEWTQRSGLLDRLRQLDTVSESPAQLVMGIENVDSCISDVVHELQRPSYSGSTTHSIRSAFRRATEQGSPGHHCVGLWRAFVLWEASMVPEAMTCVPTQRPSPSNNARSKGLKVARDVFYSALRACPWAKDLCMLGFSQPVLRDAIGNDELKQVYQSMLDRGLRVRVDISATVL